MIWVFVVSLPVIFVNSNRLSKVADFPQVWDYLGGCLFLLGFLIETISDFQKFFYKENSANRGHWCDTGESYSRKKLIYQKYFVLSFKLYRDMEMVPAPKLLWGNLRLVGNFHHSNTCLSKIRIFCLFITNFHDDHSIVLVWDSTIGKIS